MNRTIIAATLLTLAAAPAIAQNWTSNRIGALTFHNGTDANGDSWNGTSQQIGQFRFDHFSGPNGQTQNCTTTQVGSLAFTTCN